MRTRSKRQAATTTTAAAALPPPDVNKDEDENDAEENEVADEEEEILSTPEEENESKEESALDNLDPVVPCKDSEGSNTTAHNDLAAIFDAFGIEKTHEVFDKTLRQFDVVKQQCIMEALKEPQKTWLACCLYTTAWSTSAVTMKPAVQFSVIGLVDICELSVMEFFDKLERWAILMNASSRMVDHIERVQGNLSVSIVVFTKFLPIFRQIFVPNQEATLEDPDDSATNTAITTFKIYDYIWVTYCAFKKQLQKGNEDLMNSVHLLLIVTDLILGDIIAHDLMQFINKSFLVELSKSGKTVLDFYCDLYNGVPLDAKHFRSHWFYAQAKTFYEAEYLKFNAETYTEFLDNIDYNSGYLNTVYEEAIYERLEIDERIFVTRIQPENLFDETVDFGIVTNIRPIPDGTFSRNRDLLSRKASEHSLSKVNTSRCMKTPLSGRAYLATSDMVNPVTENLEMSRHQRLMLLVENHDEHMNEIYADIMNKKFDGEVAAAVDAILNKLNDVLILKVNTEKENDPNFDVAFTHDIQTHVQTIYQLLVRFLQRITLTEHQRLMNVATTIECLAGVFQRPEFITSLYICCLELVIFSYSSKREFPWSLEMAEIAPITFYKVIEPVIRCDGDLSRDILKHLSKIEERVLEELAWDRASPLWKTLADGTKIPSYEEVMIPDKNGEPLTPRSMAPLQSNVLTRYAKIGLF
uniref:Retinoblastoma-associated protein n=1 Tax=Panagrolaimus superbus TaxID=310955 RepID=A0A914Y2I4_9BILA